MFLRWKKKTLVDPPTMRVTPQVLESVRVNGEPRHKVVWTGPSFRLCNLDSPMDRVQWWKLVLLSMSKEDVLGKLATVIPRPSREEFEIYERIQWPLVGRVGESFGDMKARHWKLAMDDWRRLPTPPKVSSLPKDPRRLFAVFGLPTRFTEKDLKTAYRKAVFVHHPDKGGTVEDFRAVMEAHSILSRVV